MTDKAQPDYKGKVHLKSMNVLPHGLFPVRNCIKMWCTLRIASKSTLHLAVDLPPAENAHCPPAIDRFVKRPSTALSAPQSLSLPG